jgi:hypothetical protein
MQNITNTEGIPTGTLGGMVQIGCEEFYMEASELLPLQPDEIPEQDELAELRAEFDHFQQQGSTDDDDITLSGAAYAERAGAAWRW